MRLSKAPACLNVLLVGVYECCSPESCGFAGCQHIGRIGSRPAPPPATRTGHARYGAAFLGPPPTSSQHNPPPPRRSCDTTTGRTDMRGLGLVRRKAGLAFRPVSRRMFSATAAARADFGHVVGLYLLGLLRSGLRDVLALCAPRSSHGSSFEDETASLSEARDRLPHNNALPRSLPPLPPRPPHSHPHN